MKLIIIGGSLLTSAFLLTQPVFAQSKPADKPATIPASGALAEYKRCSGPVATMPKDCDDTRQQIVRIQAVVKLYQKGNKAVLVDLVNGAITSDSYLGETYGEFFASLAAQQPNDFLQAISVRNTADRENLFQITALSLADNQVSKVTKSMKKISKDKTNKMSSFAKEFLTAINNR
jgi:Tfp pilus assembly protein PilX